MLIVVVINVQNVEKRGYAMMIVIVSVVVARTIHVFVSIQGENA
jgi:hypothetical protein